MSDPLDVTLSVILRDYKEEKITLRQAVVRLREATKRYEDDGK